MGQVQSDSWKTPQNYYRGDGARYEIDNIILLLSSLQIRDGPEIYNIIGLFEFCTDREVPRHLII